MIEISVPYFLSEEQMERLKNLCEDGMSSKDMFVSIMQMGSKGHIDRILSIWEKMEKRD